MSNVDPSPEPPSAPEPQTSGARPGALLLVIGAIILVVGGAFLLLREDTPAAVEPATLEDAPSLQDLAELDDATPADDDAAPDFSVVTLGGGAFTLSEHLADDGRPVILNLWASWCFPCRAEMPAIDAFAASNPEVFVIGVAVQDDQVSAAEFADEIGVTYTIGLDEKDEVNSAYVPLGLPATFIIDENGIIVKRIFGGVDEDSLAADISELLGL